MIFESKDNTYEVLRLISEYEVYDTYLCRCGKSEYILLYVKDEGVQRLCCRLFLENREQDNFDGLFEIFSDGNNFIFVFVSNSINLSLKQMAEDFELTFGRKIELFQKVLAGLCVHEIPVFVACDLFMHGNMGIGDDDTGNGYYTLMELENYEKYDLVAFEALLADSMRDIFSREIRKRQYRELADFCEALDETAYGSFLEIYGAYTELAKILVDKLEKKEKNDNKSGEKGLEKAKHIITVIKTVVIIVILVASLGVLLWSLKGETSDGGGIYSYIGDIQIEEYTEDSAR